MPANTSTAAVFPDCSSASIFERTKFNTARVAIVKIMAAAINRAFFPLRILSPVVGYFGAINDLTLRGEKGQACWVRTCRGHKYKVGRNLEHRKDRHKKV